MNIRFMTSLPKFQLFLYIHMTVLFFFVTFLLVKNFSLFKDRS